MEKTRPPGDLSKDVESLRVAGLRITQARVAILHLLRHDPSHPTAEQVYHRLRPLYPSLSLATVYNTLAAFTRRGLCRRVPPLDGSQRYDGAVEPHHHALCTGCGSLFDVPLQVYQPPPPPLRLEGGLPVYGVQLTFETRCPACQAPPPGAG